MGVFFKSFGHYIPETGITNKQLAERFNISEEWILERTGIEERKYFLNGATSDMIVAAALNCLNNAEVSASNIDCIIVATMTPDYHCPSTAAIVQKKLGINHNFSLDIMAACSGYVYALQLADALIASGKYCNILVAGADKMSAIIDKNDRKTALIFADGAGCALVSHHDTENNIIDIICAVDSTLSDIVIIPNGGSVSPIHQPVFEEQNHFLRFTSKGVYESGIQLLQKAINAVTEKSKITIKDIDLIIPHQANKRMIEELARRMDVPIDKFFINVESIGNTSAATIPIALSQASEQKKLKGKILLISVGAGFTYASAIIQV